MKSLLIFIFLCIGLSTYGQTFTYSYKDPCNGNLKTVIVPSGQDKVAVTYYNQINSFNLDDFSNGVFDSWVSSIYSQYSVVSPCSGLAFTNAITQNQELTTTLTGIINTLTNLSFPSPNDPDVGEPAPTPDVESDNSSSDSPEPSSDEPGDGSSTSETGSNDNSNSSSETSQSSSNSSSGDLSSNESNSSSESGSEGGGSDVMSGTTKSVGSSGGSGSSSSKSNSSKGGGKEKQNMLKPTVVGSADLLAFSSSSSEKGGKVSGGFTTTRWDGLVSSGILFDYSTSIVGPNITGFYSFIKPKRVNLISNTLSIGFTNKGLLYNTLAVGQLRTFKKLKVIFLVSGTFGQMFQERLIGTAAITGLMYDLKLGKKIAIKFTSLFVYSPYMQYYNDLLLKSPYVILPSMGTNISLTKTFKFNINLGGAYQVNSGALNYSLTIGSRLAL
jgi:hypothetical protein